MEAEKLKKEKLLQAKLPPPTLTKSAELVMEKVPKEPNETFIVTKIIVINEHRLDFAGEGGTAKSRNESSTGKREKGLGHERARCRSPSHHCGGSIFLGQ